MKLNYNLHLAYSGNVHRGENWPETLNSLEKFTLAVREQICPRDWFGLGLRLSNQAAMELSDRQTLSEFRRWLDKNSCYVFTINGFPFGTFHGARVKENVYRPDWTSLERLAYTNLLFDLLAEILPPEIEGSVSTLPGSFKERLMAPAGSLSGSATPRKIRRNIFHCVEHISRVAKKTGRKLHLGIEPEPLCLLENSDETISFFEQLRRENKNDARLEEFLGVNYDCCHFAVEFEEPQTALAHFQRAGIKISKIHLSSALKCQATAEARAALENFLDDVYLHQVITRDENGKLKFFRDLPDAFADRSSPATRRPEEWRIHFHVPLHAPAVAPLQNTNDHLLGVLDLLAKNPMLCPHLEMETYTWEVLPPELKSRSVVDQLAAEYKWMLAELNKRGLF